MRRPGRPQFTSAPVGTWTPDAYESEVSRPEQLGRAARAQHPGTFTQELHGALATDEHAVALTRASARRGTHNYDLTTRGCSPAAGADRRGVVAARGPVCRRRVLDLSWLLGTWEGCSRCTLAAPDRP